MIKKRTTQKQIAELAGVSSQIVSRVLRSDNPRCRPEVAERVLKIAREHNYRPNRVAKQMKTNRTGTIGIIVKHLYDIAHATLQEIINEAKKHDYVIAMESFQKNDIHNITFLKEKVVDGIIVFADIDKKSFPLLNNIQEPILYYNSYKTTGYNVIVHDEHQGAELAVKRLEKAGRKKVIYLGIDQHSTHYSCTMREEGVIRACKKYNIEYVKSIFCGSSCDLDDLNLANKLAEELQDIDFDAVVLYNDLLIVHIFEAMKILHKQIPKDCSVISFNYSDLVRSSRPRITSINIPYDVLGKIITEKMIRLIDDKDSENTEILNYKITEFDSV